MIVPVITLESLLKFCTKELEPCLFCLEDIQKNTSSRSLDISGKDSKEKGKSVCCEKDLYSVA